MTRERATEVVATRYVTVGYVRRSRGVVRGRGEELAERPERLVGVALQPHVVAREHVESRRELRLERAERGKVFEVLDLVMVTQPRDEPREARSGNDRQLAGGAAPAAMLVEQCDEAVRLAPKSVVNFEPEASAMCGIVAPRAARVTLELGASFARRHGGLFGIDFQARIVREARAFVARPGGRSAPRPRVEAPGWGKVLVGGAGRVAEKSKGGAICAADAVRPRPQIY